MKIKTIKNRLDNNDYFDEEVNKALSEGWVLTKRIVLEPYRPNTGQTYYTMLYAELVKYDSETERLEMNICPEKQDQV